MVDAFRDPVIRGSQPRRSMNPYRRLFGTPGSWHVDGYAGRTYTSLAGAKSACRAADARGLDEPRAVAQIARHAHVAMVHTERCYYGAPGFKRKDQKRTNDAVRLSRPVVAPVVADVDFDGELDFGMFS